MPGDDNNLIDDAVASVDPTELEDVLGDQTPDTEEPVETPAEPEVETPVEEEPPAEEPTETPAEEPEGEPEVETPPEEPPVETPPAEEPSPKSEMDSLKAQNEKLLKLVAELTGTPQETPPEETPAQPAQPATPAPPTSPAVPPTTVTGLEELLESMDFDAVMDDKAEFGKFVTALATAVKTQTLEESSQRVLASIPQVVAGTVQRQIVFRDIQQQFFKENKELLPVKGYVAKVANAISAQNPEWTVGQVMEEAAKTSYETLGIIKKVEEEGKKSATKPKLPGSKPGGKRQVTQPSGLQSEIDDVIDD